VAIKAKSSKKGQTRVLEIQYIYLDQVAFYLHTRPLQTSNLNQTIGLPPLHNQFDKLFRCS